MVAVDRGGHGGLGEAGRHELQECHLGGGVLHRDTVGVEVVVRDPALDLGVRVGEVVDEDLLGQRERPAESLTPERHVAGQLRVHGLDEFDGGAGGHGHVDNYNTSLMRPAKSGGHVATVAARATDDGWRWAAADLVGSRIELVEAGRS